MERRRRKDRIGGAIPWTATIALKVASSAPESPSQRLSCPAFNGPTTLMLQNTPRSTAAGRAFVDRGPDRSLLTES